MLTADSLLRMPQKGHIRFAGRKSVPVLLLQREASGVLLELTSRLSRSSLATHTQSEGGAREPDLLPLSSDCLAPFQSTLPQIICIRKPARSYSLGAKRFAGASSSELRLRERRSRDSVFSRDIGIKSVEDLWRSASDFARKEPAVVFGLGRLNSGFRHRNQLRGSTFHWWLAADVFCEPPLDCARPARASERPFARPVGPSEVVV